MAKDIIKVNPDSNLIELGITPKMYVRYGDCSIWFEVLKVYKDFVICASRDPKRKTEMAMIGAYFSAINEFAQTMEKYDRFINVDRTKSFYDKFYPEIDKIIVDNQK
jgi:hypothetical protein